MNYQNLTDPKQSVYIGTTAKTGHSRILQHGDDVRRGQTKNALAKHHRATHQGLEPGFEAEILRSGVKFNLDRYVLEAHTIFKHSQNQNIQLLNQRGEFGYQPLPRLEIGS